MPGKVLPDVTQAGKAKGEPRVVGRRWLDLHAFDLDDDFGPKPGLPTLDRLDAGLDKFGELFELFVSEPTVHPSDFAELAVLVPTGQIRPVEEHPPASLAPLRPGDDEIQSLQHRFQCSLVPHT